MRSLAFCLIFILVACQRNSDQNSTTPPSPTISKTSDKPDEKPEEKMVDVTVAKPIKFDGAICPAAKSEQKPTAAELAHANKVRIQSLVLGQTLYRYLDSSGAQVALVGRAGTDMSQYKFRNPSFHKYSHVALVYRDELGIWKAAHLLNNCGGLYSDIYDQGLGVFFSDDPYLYDAHVTIPSFHIQERLAAVLNYNDAQGRNWAKLLHNNLYSVYSSPDYGKYQNSNMWVLTAIAAAKHNRGTRESAEEAYRQDGFKPSEVYGGIMKSVLKNFDSFAGDKYFPNAHMEDHSLRERATGWFRFVSAASVFNYLRTIDNVISEKELCHPQGCNRSLDQLR